MNIEHMKKRLALYLEAEEAILHGQSYSIEGLSLTRADLDTVRKVIEGLTRAINYDEARRDKTLRSRVRYIVPMESVR